MNKKQLRKALLVIKDKYISLNEMGEVALKEFNIKKYVDCLGHPDLKSHLIKTGLARDIEDVASEIPDYETAEDIINSFQYDLELLADDEMIITKELEAKRLENLLYQKHVSKALIAKQFCNADLVIKQLYENFTFTDSDGKSAAGIDSTSIREIIEEQEKLLDKGDLSSLENMLHSQAHTLNAIFTTMATQMGYAKELKRLESFGRIALKAQNQTRQTISTLAEIKGIKKTTFIHQLNKAHNQQVNNGAGENLNNSANERVLDNVDRRRTTSSQRENTPDETLAIPENTGGQTAFINECFKTRDAISENEGIRETVSSIKQTRKEG